MLSMVPFPAEAFAWGLVFGFSFVLRGRRLTFLRTIISTRRVWPQHTLSMRPIILIIETVCRGSVNGGTSWFVGMRRGGNAEGVFRM